MIMSNEEKDKLIKETLRKDNYVFSGNDSFNAIISTEIDEAKIKPAKYTHTQKKIVLILFILLVISVLINAYLVLKKPEGIFKKNSSDIIVSPIYIEDNLDDSNGLDNDDKENKDEQNTTKETENVVVKQVENNSVVMNTVVPQKTEEEKAKNENDAKEFSGEIDEGKLKEELKIYSLAIGRYDDIIDSKEENTILLVMASNAFEKQRMADKTNKEANEYALLKDNVDLFIEEITGNKPNQNLESYNNYIGYSVASNAYIWGKDGNPFASEEYEVLTCEFSSKNNSGFRVSGLIEKIVNGERCVYHYSATIASNNNEYRYMPYQIKSFTYNLDEGQDNVFRIVDKVEEVDPKSKKKN